MAVRRSLAVESPHGIKPMPKPKRTTPFTCFYCGIEKPAEAASDEHIVPSCIGGSRNVTLTDSVCGECNDFMSKHVDLPFARDWFIEAARLLAGIKHRRKPPVMYLGELDWDREERVHVTVTERGVTILEVEHPELKPPRLVVAIDDEQPDLLDHFRQVWKRRFDGQPVINAHGWKATPREESVTNTLMGLPTPYKVSGRISVTAWHREVVKMALGLACLQFQGFESTDAAERLRLFLFENDHANRDALALPGRIGIEDSTPSLTAMWHPGAHEHLFALVEVDRRVVFVANLFGKYENFVEIDRSGLLAGRLPGGGPARGVAWVVDGVAKTTRGPTAIADLLGV